MLNNFNLGKVFALGLIHIIKNKKSFAIGLWTKKIVKQLLLPLDYYIKAIRLEKT